MINSDIKALLSAQNYAVLTTVLPSGTAASHMMWAGCDDTHVTINTEIHRHKFRHLPIGAKATVLVFESPYKWAEVRGTVVEHVGGDAARAHIDELSMRYTGNPYGMPIQSERVIVKIAPDYQFSFPPAG
jgi:general stress protein 26